MRKNLVGFDTSLLDVTNHAKNSSHDSMPHWCHRYDTPGYDATNHASNLFAGFDATNYYVSDGA